MKMTRKQTIELADLKTYIPDHCDWQEKNEEDIKKFFEWSERGLHKDDVHIPTYTKEGRTYFHALVWAKKWRERSFAMQKYGMGNMEKSYKHEEH